MAEAPLRVLVIEDHADTLKYLSMYLEQSGHHVQCARSLNEAIETLSSSTCDVILSDIGLTDGSGWELLKKLDLRTRVYAIAMSGFGMTSDVNRSRAAGFRHHLVKPIDPDLLDRHLAEAAREKGAHERNA